MLKNIIARRLLAWFLITAFVLMPVSTAYADDLDTIKNILITDYYRPLTAQELASSSIEELLTLLKDPHTFVMNNQEEKQFLDSIEGEWALIGIGIKETTLVPLSDTSLHFYVINVVLQDSAAEAAGIQVGDYLTAIDGILTANMTLEEVYEQLNKPVGVQIQLTLKRDSQTMIKQVSPQAYQVPIITSEMLDGNILYVHLSSMGQQIDQEMGKVLRQYSNASGIILDLTGNSGGHTYSTRSLANLLLSEGRFIGFKNRSFIQWLYLTKPAAYQQPIVCLVNHESASAAEMLPAVLQDYSRALIVGETTYGKFSSQTIVSISSDLNLKYTVAQVLTPKGRNLDRIGLVPDLQMDPLPAARFAYDLLLQTTATDKKHALIIDPVADQAYLDAKTLHASDVITQEETNFIKLRDAATAMKLPLEWNAATGQAQLWHNSASYPIDPNSPDVLWQDGSLYISTERLAQYVLGDLVYDDGNILLYYN